MEVVWQLSAVAAVARVLTVCVRSLADLRRARIQARAGVDQRQAEGAVMVQAVHALGANGLAVYEERPDGSRLVIAPADTLTALGRPDSRPLAQHSALTALPAAGAPAAAGNQAA